MLFRILVAVLFSASVSANAAVITTTLDFSSASDGPVSGYTEDGYIVNGGIFNNNEIELGLGFLVGGVLIERSDGLDFELVSFTYTTAFNSTVSIFGGSIEFASSLIGSGTYTAANSPAAGVSLSHSASSTQDNPAIFLDNIILRADVPEVPLPAAAWLFMSALGGLLGVGRLRRKA